MSDFYNLPVGKRTRHGRLRYAQGLNGNDESRTCGFSKNRDKKRNRETEDDEINKKGSNGAGRPKKRKLAIKEEILSSDESESEEEESDENGSGDNFISSESDESSSDESGEDSGDREESEDLSKSNEEDATDEKGFDGMKSRPCGSSSGYGKDIEIIEVDDYWINRKGSKGSSSLTKIELPEAKPVNKSLVAQSHEEQSIENGLGVRSTSVDLDKSSVDVSTEGGRDEEGTDAAAVGKNEKKECYGSAAKSDSDIMVVSDDEEGFGVSSTSVDLDKSSVDVSTEGGSDQEGTDAAAVAKHEKKECYGSTDESDSDVMVVSDDEEGWIDYFPPNKTPNHPSATESEKEYSDTETEYSDTETETETESESIQSDDSDYLLPKEAPKVRAVKEKLRSTNIKEKGRSVKKEMYDLNNDIDTHKKANGKGKVRVTDNIEKGVKNQESKKGKRKDVGGSIDAILDLIIGQEDDLHKNGSDDCIPLKFRFDDSDDDSASQTNYESDVEALFQQMNFELRSEEIGSYGNPKAENQDKLDGYKDHDTKATHFNCERGNHAYIYLEEQIGLRCGLCGAVILESRHVIPKLATYAPDTPKRGYPSSEQQFLNSENAHFHYSDEGKPREICMQTKGTVWELIPKNIQGDLYPHQQKGFKFLWENLAGTIELQGLQKLGPCGRGGGGGGCIISHAPGTGKTLLTIVFIESFLNRFPKCCPLIIVPSNMLDTWEAEFKKWQVGFSFINLNTTDSLSKEMNISFRNNIDLIRAFKISSWCDGKSVLGVSYSLFEKIIGNTNTKKVNLEKMGNVLLDKPGLVILDEGHTPRNHRSNIWNILLKLKTKNRVILSGTPFQNNFRELFNTLRLVRPETAANIGSDKIFADMLQGKNKNKLRSMSTPEDIEKLKKIIAPFVNVHNGHILESKLPGLKQSIVLLNPPPLQKGLIENLDKLSNTFEYEHKVALVSVHPSLILSCILTEKEKNITNKQELEMVRLHPDVGVKTRFVMEVIRLSVSLQEKVLIFSQYTAPLDLLKDQIAHVFSWDFGREIMLINGGTHQKLRQTIINDFNDPNSKSKVLLASIKCCSEGIHLTGASRVVLLDIVWNPSVDTQAISRAYRLGQEKVVYTYHLMVAGTTEEEKYDKQVEKGRLAEMVFSSFATEDPKSNVNKDVIELNDKILAKLVEHQDLKKIFKKIRYPESKARI